MIFVSPKERYFVPLGYVSVKSGVININDSSLLSEGL
jgi:hypothetical protein